MSPRDPLASGQQRVADDDEKLLSLPATRRNSSKNTSGPFPASDFTFEDLGSREGEKDGFTCIEHASRGKGWKCHMIERIATSKCPGCARQELWPDKQSIKLERNNHRSRAGLMTADFNKNSFPRLR